MFVRGAAPLSLRPAAYRGRPGPVRFIEQHPPTRRGIIVNVMVGSADEFVDFMAKTTKAKVRSRFFVLAAV